MSTYLLICVTLWSFGGGYQETPSAIDLVETPEHAAIAVWEVEYYNKLMPHPDQNKWILYEFNPADGKIKEIKIPEFTFKKRSKK